jgi:hypothetical protein
MGQPGRLDPDQGQVGVRAPAGNGLTESHLGQPRLGSPGQPGQ